MVDSERSAPHITLPVPVTVILFVSAIGMDVDLALGTQLFEWCSLQKLLGFTYS